MIWWWWTVYNSSFFLFFVFIFHFSISLLLLPFLSPSLVMILERHDVHSDLIIVMHSVESRDVVHEHWKCLVWSLVIDSIAPLTWHTTKQFIVISHLCVVCLSAHSTIVHISSLLYAREMKKAYSSLTIQFNDKKI